MDFPLPPPDRPREPLVFSAHWLGGVAIAVGLVLGFLVALVVAYKLLT